MFKQDLEVIDNLRQDAVNVKEPHVSGLKKIAAYAAQLSWIGGKFPIDVRQFWQAGNWRITN
jgi:programmed cell death 6-interacting protein